MSVELTMPRASDLNHATTITDSIANICRLGERLAVIETDVDAIEALPVDDNGEAEALVNVGISSLRIGIQLPPAEMLLAKRKEVYLAIEALEAEFNEFLKHAAELTSRCELATGRRVATPRFAIDLKRMEREIMEMNSRGPELNSAPALER